MGRSISAARHRKLQELERRGRRCQCANADGSACAVAATVIIEETTTDLDAKGLVKSGPTTKEMQYCMRHFRGILRAARKHGVMAENRYELTTQTNFSNGGAQVTTYYLDTFRALD